nr:metallophosphoesterase [Limosilactobacillus kribbianus]
MVASIVKVLIISDNHREENILTQVGQRWIGQVDLMIHCGDSELAPTQPSMKQFDLAVAGNNDWGLDYPNDGLLTADGVRIFATHGHRYGVNSSLTRLMLKGEEERADIVCYGHTHQLAVTSEKGMLMINPGSISLPRGQFARLGGTFAVVDAQPTKFVVDYYDRQSQPVEQLHFEFKR